MRRVSALNKDSATQLLKDYSKGLKHFLVGMSVEKKCIWIGYMSDKNMPGDAYHFKNRMQGVNIVKFVEACHEGTWYTPT